MIIDWKEIAFHIYDTIKAEVSVLKEKPTLWAILVWDNASSIRYINQKMKWAKYTWINFELIKLKEDISEDELLEHIKSFNKNKNINWYIVQLPLPKHINEKNIINSIKPKKDVDWFHPKNQWKILIWDNSWLVPCTPAWIMEIFSSQDIDLVWKVVCVIGRSNIVWKPIAALLINAWATVISCNSNTKDITKFTKQADIVIVATGCPWLLKEDMLKQDSIVIDVWFTVKDWVIYWDAETIDIDSKWHKVTPVPGWVWALTVALLMKNVVKTTKK
jgi:methylenetetrahydrofolate dehydrogenase (NADP+) / methenyltetrahydrofolate cyclohydrolase